jgi:diacylglycerol kinase (ATP)
MDKKEKILFIINPISGGKNKERFLALLDKIPDKNRYSIESILTEYPGHAAVLARDAVARRIPKVVAVGGDGTVNEVARELIGSNTALGIIPFGSGNGLARHLKISQNPSQALQQLNNATPLPIDVGFLNDQPFFCTAGIGFDAQVGKAFAKMKGRGVVRYIWAALREYFSYTSEEYEVEVNKRTWRYRALLLTVANTTQYGNNFHIAPQANIRDGLLDICVIKNILVYRVPMMLLRIFSRTIHKSSAYSSLQAAQFVVRRKNKGPYHLDGEPFDGNKEFVFAVKEKSLQVLVEAPAEKLN